MDNIITEKYYIIEQQMGGGYGLIYEGKFKDYAEAKAHLKQHSSNKTQIVAIKDDEFNDLINRGKLEWK